MKNIGWHSTTARECKALYIEINNVGRIKNASIDLKNITMFVGKNDSGKTYAACTIWAIINYIKNIRDINENDRPKEINTIINDMTINIKDDEINHNFSISEEILDEIQQQTFICLNKDLPNILHDAIGYDGFNDSKINFKHFSHSTNVNINVIFRKEKKEGNMSDQIGSRTPEDHRLYSVTILMKYGENIFYSIAVDRTFVFDVEDTITSILVQKIIGIACFGLEWRTLQSPLYIPAARTGIILALDYYVDATMRMKRSPERQKELPSNLPAPLEHFASSVSMPFFHVGRENKVTEILSKLLNGNIKRSNRRSSFNYSPYGTNIDLPLAATSSLVTELAALVLMSESIREDTFLIIEEPEAHLHLEAQRMMARVIAQASRSGVKLLITTHSDTFIQQINNLIALSDHPKSSMLLEKFELTKDETIPREKVAAYDFICENGVTNPEPLKLTRMGFVAESLNEILIRLADETTEISESWT